MDQLYVARDDVLQAFDSRCVTVEPEDARLAPGKFCNLTQMTAGTSRASFYFKGTTVGAFDAHAAIANLTEAVQTQTVKDPALNSLEFTSGAQTLFPGSCSAGFDLEARDKANQALALVVSTPVTLSASQAVTFFSDSLCAAPLPLNVLTWPAGMKTARFYLKATTVGSTTVTATFPGGMPTASQPVVVIPGTPDALAFATPPTTAAACKLSTEVKVRTVDSNGYPTPATATTSITVSATGGLQLFTDATASTMLTGPLVLAKDATDVSFYFRGSTPLASTLTASATGLKQATQPATVAVGAEAKLA